MISWKRGYYEWHRESTEENKIYEPDLRKIKGYEVLRYRQKFNNLIYDKVQIVNKQRDATLFCVLYYKEDDAFLAQKVLDFFFDSLKF